MDLHPVVLQGVLILEHLLAKGARYTLLTLLLLLFLLLLLLLRYPPLLYLLLFTFF